MDLSAAQPNSVKIEKHELNSHNGLTSLSRCLAGNTGSTTKVAVGGEKVLAIVDVTEQPGQLPTLSVCRQLGSRVRKVDLVRVTDVKWHPTNPNRIGTASASGMVLVWDVHQGSHDHLRRTGSEDMKRTEHTRLVKRICWHPSQEAQLLSASQDSTVKLWDLRMYKTTSPLTFRTSPVGSIQIRDVEVDPFDHNAFVCSTDETAELLYWDIRMHDRGPKRRISASLESSGKGAVNSLNWHPTKPGCLVTGSKDRSIRVWDMHSAVDDLQVTPRIVIQTLAAVGRLQWRPSVNTDSHQIGEVSMSPLDADLNVWDEASPLLPLCCVRKPHGEVITDLEWWDDNGELIFSTSKSGSFAVSSIRNSFVHSTQMCTSSVAWAPGDGLTFFNDTVHFPEAGRVRGDLTCAAQQRGSTASSVPALNASRFGLYAQAPHGMSPRIPEPTPVRANPSPISPTSPESANTPPILATTAAPPRQRAAPKPPQKKSTGLFSGLFSRRRSHSDHAAPTTEEEKQVPPTERREDPRRSCSQREVSELRSHPQSLAQGYGGVRPDITSSASFAALNTPSRRCTIDYVSPFPQQTYANIPLGLRQEPGQGVFYSLQPGAVGDDFSFLAKHYLFIEKSLTQQMTPAMLCEHNAGVVRQLQRMRVQSPHRREVLEQLHASWHLFKSLIDSEMPEIRKVASHSSTSERSVHETHDSSCIAMVAGVAVVVASYRTSETTPPTPPLSAAVLAGISVAAVAQTQAVSLSDHDPSLGEHSTSVTHDSDVFAMLNIVHADEGDFSLFEDDGVCAAEVDRSVWSPADIFISLVDTLLDLGEVQTAVTALLCLRAEARVFNPASHAARGAEWVVSYHDLLLASDLHTVAAAVMKYCPFPSVSAKGGLIIDAKCKSCGEILPPLTQVQMQYNVVCRERNEQESNLSGNRKDVESRCVLCICTFYADFFIFSDVWVIYERREIFSLALGRGSKLSQALTAC